MDAKEAFFFSSLLVNFKQHLAWSQKVTLCSVLLTVNLAPLIPLPMCNILADGGGEKAFCGLQVWWHRQYKCCKISSLLVGPDSRYPTTYCTGCMRVMCKITRAINELFSQQLDRKHDSLLVKWSHNLCQ